MKNLLKFIEISQNFLVSSINIQKLIQINVKIFPTFFKIFSKITLTFLYSYSKFSIFCQKFYKFHRILKQFSKLTKIY